MSGAEKRLSWLLAVVLTLWVTEGWHGIGCVWTGLAVACVTLLLCVRFISSDEFVARVNILTSGLAH
jgi:hypothetical protein